MKMEYVNEKLNEFNKFLNSRKVAIIGLGVSNIPLIDYLYEKKAVVTIFEENDIDKISPEIIKKIELYGFSFYFGKTCLENLKGFDLIFRSPSCLPTKLELQEEENRGAIVTTEIEMLMKIAPSKIIGVTGSDGKTTTTSLINVILQEAGYTTHLGGNIGIPLFDKLEKIKPEDIIVLELSSFQLMGIEVSPNIAVITNITPNHLNIHKDYEEYIDAKKNIIKYQNEDGIAVLNYDNEIVRGFKSSVEGKAVFFSSKEKLENGFILDNKVIKECDDKIRKHLVDVKDIGLRGKHNYENILAALAATKDLVDMEKSIETIKTFKAVEHRLEFVREIDGVKWYNDSVSSSPTRTIAGLNAFEEEIILIAGGYDKNLDYVPLAKPIVDNVKKLILLGQTSEKIFDAVKEQLDIENKDLDIFMCDSLEQTIQLAKRLSKKEQIVLFSPASASFDMFKNAVERGKKFKEIVNNI